MTNTQPVEKEVDSFHIEIHSVFKTIQGEGPHAGLPAVFVRVAGCSLQCPACDTDYTSKREVWKVEDLVLLILNLETVEKLVVITGGEPLRQESTQELIRRLVNNGLLVQVETNGLHLSLQHQMNSQQFCIVCSPKTNRINPDFKRFWESYRWFYWKYILDADHVSEEDGLPTSSLGMSGSPDRPSKDFPREKIFLQPMDSRFYLNNSRNKDAVVKSCLKYGYRCSLQLHKLLGLE
jgi:7-carboxy-7-deazaguanine synthase